jgi:DNA-binding CsgD family transcriptional regulator/PAS domain-containing protein
MECSETYVRDGWIWREERYRAWPTILRRGVGTDLDFTSADAIAHDPYYQDFLGRHGLRWFAGVKVAHGDDEWCLSIQRSIEQGPFSSAELRMLSVLPRHLSGAVALARVLGFARAEAAVEALEVSGTAVVLLDRSGEVLRVNKATERLFGPDLQVTRKRLVSKSHPATAKLDQAIRSLLWTEASSALKPPIALPCGRGQPLLAYPVRLAGVSRDALAPCQALVLIIDLNAHPRPPETSLRTLFGLTTAEATLAARLASGASIESIAKELDVAYETARNHLKSIFAKTNTHRQAEFISLVAPLLTPWLH